MRKILVTEILLSFLLGAVPMLLVSNQPEFSATKSLATLTPGDIVVNYFLYLLFIHTLVWFVNRQVLKTSQTISVFFHKLHEITHKLGFAIHGIYRVLAGAVPIAMFLELDRLGLVQGWQAITVLSMTLAIASLFASVALSKATEYTAPRVSLFSR
ncbi:hypothetical protein [Vibrio coralliilyticus]|uniref:hypothetical protein n=1 Tax=Vibrio coralliilyticus TaxID=190893 RepID=UPI0015602A70|nr:hypothetical protein [Vibrio coralliilyticus]NRF31097.1 hypothetical protein [Vibrio coralliilyticus]NRF50934.1 hypothetical protein [Vibrio coralliilyticus]NRG04656.1 hypothetical protein [Vibrio coralliilyticus]